MYIFARKQIYGKSCQFFFLNVKGRFIRGSKTPSVCRHCRLESFCASVKFLCVSNKLAPKTSKKKNKSGKIPDSLERFRTVWKIFRQLKQFPDSLESFQAVEKVSGQSGKFPGSVRSIRKVWTFSRQSGNFRTVWKVFGQSRKFPDSEESFQAVKKVSGQSEKFPGS